MPEAQSPISTMPVRRPRAAASPRARKCTGEEVRLATFARLSSGECARGDAFFEECWGVEMKISLRESSTFAKVRRVKGV